MQRIRINLPVITGLNTCPGMAGPSPAEGFWSGSYIQVLRPAGGTSPAMTTEIWSIQTQGALSAVTHRYRVDTVPPVRVGLNGASGSRGPGHQDRLALASGMPGGMESLPCPAALRFKLRVDPAPSAVHRDIDAGDPPSAQAQPQISTGHTLMHESGAGLTISDSGAISQTGRVPFSVGSL